MVKVAVALGGAQAEKEHRQPVVVAATLADLPPAPDDRTGDAVDRPARDRNRQVRPGERGVPGGGEAPGIGAGAQAIGGLERATDDPAGGGDAARVGERGDEALLHVGGPAVAPGADGHGGEAGGGGHPPAWSMGAACRTEGCWGGWGD